MWNSQHIFEKVSVSADRFGFHNKQQLKQLNFVLAKCDPQNVYDGLIQFFLEKHYNNSDRQELAGKLLYSVSPDAHFDFKQTIKASLIHWDVSVEEFPYYFVEKLGLQNVCTLLDEINSLKLSKDEFIALDTIQYWVKNYENFTHQHQ